MNPVEPSTIARRFRRAALPLAISLALAACSGDGGTADAGLPAASQSAGESTGDSTGASDPSSETPSTVDTAVKPANPGKPSGGNNGNSGTADATTDPVPVADPAPVPDTSNDSSGGTTTNPDTTTDPDTAGDSGSTPDTDTTDSTDSSGGTANSGVATGGEAAIERMIASLTDVGTKGKTYYVATTGNDSNSGQSLSAPFRTIEKAVGIVNPGDTVEVRGGTYTPSGSGYYVSRGGTANARIKIKAYNGEKVVFNATSKQYAMYLWESAPYWIVEGIEMSGGTSYTIKIDSHHVNLVRNNIHGSSNDNIKLVQTSNDIVIFGNEIHHPNAAVGANAQGIDITGGSRVWVAHNYVHDINSIGMYAKGNSRNVVFENNRVENIAQRAIMLGQSTGTQYLFDGVYESYDGIIRNNIIINTNDACLATASSYNVKIYNNSCYNVAKTSHGAIFISNESALGTRGEKIDIRNNIIVTNAGRPVVKIGPSALSDPSTLTLENNIYWSGGSPVVFMWGEDRGMWNVSMSTWLANTTYDRTSRSVDPKYTSTSTLMITQDSPAIDGGFTTDVVKEDYNRNPRPLGGKTDIGAYEVK